MLKTLTTAFGAFAFVLTIGMLALPKTADAGPWCYRTGSNTVQCTR
jgi:hypothetical protein